MRARIIADMAVTVMMGFFMYWWVYTIPFRESEVSVSEGFAVMVSIYAVGGWVLFLLIKIIKWIHKG